MHTHVAPSEYPRWDSRVAVWVVCCAVTHQHLLRKCTRTKGISKYGSFSDPVTLAQNQVHSFWFGPLGVAHVEVLTDTALRMVDHLDPTEMLPKMPTRANKSIVSCYSGRNGQGNSAAPSLYFDIVRHWSRPGRTFVSSFQRIFLTEHPSFNSSTDRLPDLCF